MGVHTKTRTERLAMKRAIFLISGMPLFGSADARAGTPLGAGWLAKPTRLPSSSETSSPWQTVGNTKPTMFSHGARNTVAALLGDTTMTDGHQAAERTSNVSPFLHAIATQNPFLTRSRWEMRTAVCGSSPVMMTHNV